MEHVTSPRLRELVGRAHEVARTAVATNAEREDADGSWPGPAFCALADAGLLGLHVPHELGGHGEGLAGLVAITETLACESPSTALCYAMHCVGTAVIAAKATDYQKQAYLEPIARGEHVTSLALSEPGTGSHFWLPEALLEPDAGGFRVRGTKSFVTSGGHADSYVVSVASPESDLGEGAFSCVVVDRDAPGTEWSEPWQGLGMRSNSSRGLLLHDVSVPATHLLGEPGDQLWYVFEVVAPYFLMAMAGTYAGVAAAALEEARAHLGTRRHTHTGELLGTAPVLAHRLGELWIRTESTRRLIHAAAAAGDAGEDGALVALLACKAAAADAAVEVTNEAMTLVGGIGYRANGKLARLLRDARAGHVMSPTTDILKTWVGRALLNQSLV